MNILRATLVLTEGTDLVLLHTDLPSSMPNVTQQNLIVKFDVAHDQGVAYLAEHFPHLEVTVINRSPARG